MTRQKRTSGLVLSELVIAIFIAGLIAVGVAVQLGGTVTLDAQAVQMYNTTQKMASNWRRIASSCGVNSDVSPSLLLANGRLAADVFTQGGSAINTQFLNCYQRSNVRLLTDAIQVASSGPQILRHSFTVMGGGMQPFIAQFSSTSAELTYSLASRYGNLQSASLRAQDLTNPNIRYWPDPNIPNSYIVQILVGHTAQLASSSGSIIGTTSTGLAAPPPASTGAVTPAGLATPTTLPPPPVITPQALSSPAPSSSGTTAPSGPPPSAPPPPSSGPPPSVAPPPSSGPPPSAAPPPSSGGAPSPGPPPGHAPGTGGSSGYPPLPDLPASPQSLGMPCGSGWNGVSKTIDDGKGHVTVFYAGYDMSGLAPFNYTADYSSVTATGGTINATANGTISSSNASLQLCVAQRSYAWDAASKAWSYDSWAKTYGSGSVSNGQMCLTSTTSTGNGNASANLSDC